MVFSQMNYSDENSNLLKLIESNYKTAANIRRQISISEQANEAKKEEEISSRDEVKISFIPEKTDAKIDVEFEDNVNYFLDDYIKLEDNFTKQDLIDILPSSSDYRYKDLLMRLIAESLKEIKELTELVMDGNSDKEDLDELKRYVLTENRKIAYLKELLFAKTENISLESEVKNNVILAPTTTGNIRILDDLEHVPAEFYPGVKDLIDSIIDGSFKGVKRFNNNNTLNGLCEVKGYGVRVVFQRVAARTYALITTFVKKTTNDRAYQDSLRLKYADYKLVEDYLKCNYNNPEFIKENDLYLKQLYGIIAPEEKAPQYKKEVD